MVDRNCSYYMINVFKPIDEEGISYSIYKFQSIGNTNKKYGWVNLETIGGGVGTATDNWGKIDMLEGFSEVFKYTDKTGIERLIKSDSVLEVLQLTKNLMESFK